MNAPSSQSARFGFQSVHFKVAARSPLICCLYPNRAQSFVTLGTVGSFVEGPLQPVLALFIASCSST